MLTEGQKLARRVVREAARRIIAEVDKSDWRKECVEFNADFHLGCVRYDKASAFGQPMSMSWPIYIPIRS